MKSLFLKAESGVYDTMHKLQNKTACEAIERPTCTTCPRGLNKAKWFTRAELREHFVSCAAFLDQQNLASYSSCID